jgi:hypothetical protein
MDSKQIFTGGFDDKISQWAVPEHAYFLEVNFVLSSLIAPKDAPLENSEEEQPTSKVSSCCFGVTTHST